MKQPQKYQMNFLTRHLPKNAKVIGYEEVSGGFNNITNRNNMRQVRIAYEENNETFVMTVKAKSWESDLL